MFEIASISLIRLKRYHKWCKAQFTSVCVIDADLPSKNKVTRKLLVGSNIPYGSFCNLCELAPTEVPTMNGL